MTARPLKIAEALLRRVNRSHWKVQVAPLRYGGANGRCIYQSNVIRLDVEHVFFDSDAEVLDTVAHELAHVIACNEPENNWHGDMWRETYDEIRSWLAGGECDWLGEMPDEIAALLPVTVSGSTGACK
jgi:predicted SprT family Zn-dependent metalloprotease